MNVLLKLKSIIEEPDLEQRRFEFRQWVTKYVQHATVTESIDPAMLLMCRDNKGYISYVIRRAQYALSAHIPVVTVEGEVCCVVADLLFIKPPAEYISPSVKTLTYAEEMQALDKIKSLFGTNKKSEPVYLENYVPENTAKFYEMLKDFQRCNTKKNLCDHVSIFTLDMSYPRQDLMVAWGRVERENGWHT